MTPMRVIEKRPSSALSVWPSSRNSSSSRLRRVGSARALNTASMGGGYVTVRLHVKSGMLAALRRRPAGPDIVRVLLAPVAQGIERCPAEAEVACSIHAGRIARVACLRPTVGTSRPAGRRPAIGHVCAKFVTNRADVAGRVSFAFVGVLFLLHWLVADRSLEAPTPAQHLVQAPMPHPALSARVGAARAARNPVACRIRARRRKRRRGRAVSYSCQAPQTTARRGLRWALGCTVACGYSVDA